jgi:hypothetical protein
MRNPLTGEWVPKKVGGNDGANTMFPKNWSEQRIANEISSAWNGRTYPDPKRPDLWQGESSSGVTIQGYINKNPSKITAYPLYNGGKK